MIPAMRRGKQQIGQAQCIQLLQDTPRGVMAVHGADGYPYAFPMNHIYLDGKLYFHSAREGHKLDALAREDKVSFCVMDQGVRKDGDGPLHINSVIVFGRVKKLDDPQEAVAVIRQLGLKHYPTEESVDDIIQRSMSKVQMLELTIDHMTGKLVNES